MKMTTRSRPIRRKTSTKIASYTALTWLVGSTTAAMANGLSESESWQFRSDFERAALVAVADMIERKKGGFYDGFTTVINNVSTTNIGTQINCTIGANAIGNQAENGQTGNVPSVNVDANNRAGAAGNDSASITEGDGGAIGSDQNNDGQVDAGVDGNITDVDTGRLNGGVTDAVLNNDQDNSGNQTADVLDSVACDIPNATITGDVLNEADNSISLRPSPDHN